MERPSSDTSKEAEWDLIRQKRIATLLGAYEIMKRRYLEIDQCTILHPGLVAATVEEYLRERDILMTRDSIPHRIQFHKIAGLMAAAIVRNRPIQLKIASATFSYDNEFLAVFNGLALCAEGAVNAVPKILDSPNFSKWFYDLVHLLRQRPTDRESFVMIFETFSLTYFPSNMNCEE